METATPRMTEKPDDDAAPEPTAAQKARTAEQQAHANFVASAVAWDKLLRRPKKHLGERQTKARSSLSKFP